MGNLRKAKRALATLLQSAEGRDALKELVGIEIEPVSEQEATKIEADNKRQQERPRVAVLRPVYDKPEPEAQEGLNQMALVTRQIADVFSPEGVRDASVVHWTRNHLLAKLLKTGEKWTHVLFIDDDIIPPPDGLARMLMHGKDIVGALCTKRMFPPMPTAKEFNRETGAIRPMLELTGEEGLIEVGAIGTGMILLSKHALEQVAAAYFECSYETKYLGMTSEVAAQVRERRLKFFDEFKDAFWFRFLPTISGAAEYGEDIGFCVLAREICEIPVYCDTTIQPQHIGRYGFSMKDFLPYQARMQKKSLAVSNPTIDPQFTDEEALSAEDQKQAEDLERERTDYPVSKSKLKISILVPTRGRPDSVRRLVNSIGTTMHGPAPEIVFYVDEDDPAGLPLQGDGFKVIRGPRITLSECWNKCAEVATGDILFNGGDDLLFRTKGWDSMVKDEFEQHRDKIIFVHGDDLAPEGRGRQFGTHGFVHRKWVDAVGYFIPPYFSSDYGDTWLNEVANSLGRRVFLPFVTEHLHPLWGKAEWDQTHKERLERHKADKVDELYASLAPRRKADVELLRAQCRPLVSVLIPSRGRLEQLRKSVEYLMARSNYNDVEIIVRTDDDEQRQPLFFREGPQIITGPRHGYRFLYRYYNEMAEQARGEWLMLWNDDSLMQEKGWDAKLATVEPGLRTVNITGEFNTFPIVHRSLYELLGHLSLQAHCDTWLQQVGRTAGIEKYLPMAVAHTSRDEQKRPAAYKETRPEFYSDSMQALVLADIDKILVALGRLPVEQAEAVAVG